MPVDATPENLVGAVVAAITAALAGLGRSHMKIRDRLKTSEVRLNAV